MNNTPSKTPFAKRSFGQNFLIDPNVIKRIIAALNIKEDDTIVEIGSGRGALTGELVKSGANVIAIELDRDLTPQLMEKFGDAANFRLVEQDALKIDFGKIINTWLQPPATAGASDKKLVANLPYYISTAILQRLIEQRFIFSEMVLMFQREVVERIAAQPGNSERGFLTVLVEAYLSVERLFDVPPAAFRPVPKVWSSVVRLHPRDTEIPDEELFRRLVSTAFAQKRKTILNNLKTAFPNAATALDTANIDPSRRAETLALREWIALSESLNRVSK